MNAPECKTLKDKYDDCFQGWKKTPIMEMNLGGLSKCDDCFQDYKDCVEIIMKAKIDAKKNKK